MENKPYTNFLNAMKSEGVTFSQIADLQLTISDRMKDIDKLKLSPDVNSKRWNLIVDTEKKQVLVELLW